MSEKDWFVSQGINFQNNQQQSQTIVTEEYTQTSSELPKKKMQVIASEKNPFGQKTLAGITLIIFTLSIQLVILVVSGLSSPSDTTSDIDDLESTIEDLEKLKKIQLWFSIFVIGFQLIGVKMIYDDVRNLSEHLDHDIEIRNNNLNILAQQINKK
tara:strand:+ start:134 stop:601 length:468 start_codon:yes stop_codon:yes gene_type:complete